MLSIRKNETKENGGTEACRKIALKHLRLLIVRILGKTPTGRTSIVLWNTAKRSEYGFTLHEFDDMLTLLREEGVINCTNKRWWLSDSSRMNWAKVSNE